MNINLGYLDYIASVGTRLHQQTHQQVRESEGQRVRGTKLKLATFSYFRDYFLKFPDNSVQDNSARTIRRDNLSRTIRRKVYIINFIENPASTQQYSLHQSRFHFSNFFINLASISAISFN